MDDSSSQALTPDLPLPPPEYRRLVGLPEASFYAAGVHHPVFDHVPPDAFRSVLDFGCGCGRLARSLMLRRPPSSRYVGLDRHAGMIDWCRTSLTPVTPAFEFLHHDVRHPVLNPGGVPGHLPLPARDGEITLFLGISIFTHLLEADAAFYLDEMGRVLSPNGIAATTWFLFDKGDFPFMQEFQNALMINPDDLTNAVVFDRRWLLERAGQADLVMTRAVPPTIRGFHWTLYFERRAAGRIAADFPADAAVRGIARPPLG